MESRILAIFFCLCHNLGSVSMTYYYSVKPFKEVIGSYTEINIVSSLIHCGIKCAAYNCQNFEYNG